ncbi:MAG: hypothetical protein AAB646_03220, partial [Patescibacteria group bacterium]
MRHLAVDIGTTAIKIAEFDETGSLKNYVIVQRHQRPFHSSIHNLSLEDAVPAIKIGIQKAGIQAMRAAVAVPAFAAFTSISNFIPIKFSSLATAHFETEPGKNLSIAVPADFLINYQKIFAGAGIDIISFELENLSLARLLTRGKNEVVM